MSYDVSVNCTHCGCTVVDANYTTNMAWLWRHEGCDLREYDGKQALEMLPRLQIAIDAMESEISVFGDQAYKHNPETKNSFPSNGWGDVHSCLGFLKDLRDGLCRCPDGIVRVSY